MFSRAHILIENEYDKLKTNSPWGIEAHPLHHDNIFEWVAKIKGLKDTLWEGGIFRVYMKFDEHFNSKPPEVCFHTIPFHPNIDMITGRPCVEFLDDYTKWKDTYSVSYILLTIQNLLSSPNLDSPINPEAADMMVHSSQAYRQMVLECVAASQRVEVGVSPHVDTESRVRFSEPHQKAVHQMKRTPQKSPMPKISRLSFDDYHNTWCGIATSKPALEMKNPLLEAIKDRPDLQRAHLGLPEDEIEDQMKRQIEEHDQLMYGRFKSKKETEEEEKAAKMAKLSRMRKIYLPPRISPAPSAVPPPSGGGKLDIGEPLEHEVEDLLAWSSKLDVNSVDHDT